LAEAERSLTEISILAKAGLAVIVYCDGVDCPLSPELARTLQKRGVPSVKVIVDGWRLWSEAGYPVEGGER
jgi:3-mercaptopyruvate sulfurtransferase SseA